MIGQNAGEKFANITRRNNVYWSYFCINRVKTLFVNLKSLKPLKFFKTISGFSLALDLSNHTWKLPWTSRETVPLSPNTHPTLGRYWVLLQLYILNHLRHQSVWAPLLVALWCFWFQSDECLWCCLTAWYCILTELWHILGEYVHALGWVPLMTPLRMPTNPSSWVGIDGQACSVRLVPLQTDNFRLLWKQTDKRQTSVYTRSNW
jgi:hypothetical protein